MVFFISRIVACAQRAVASVTARVPVPDSLAGKRRMMLREGRAAGRRSHAQPRSSTIGRDFREPLAVLADGGDRQRPSLNYDDVVAGAAAGAVAGAVAGGAAVHFPLAPGRTYVPPIPASASLDLAIAAGVVGKHGVVKRGVAKRAREALGRRVRARKGRGKRAALALWHAPPPPSVPTPAAARCGTPPLRSATPPLRVGAQEGCVGTTSQGGRGAAQGCVGVRDFSKKKSPTLLDLFSPCNSHTVPV